MGIEIGKQTTLQLIAAGYVLFALALLVLRFRTPRAPTTESEEEEDEEEEETKQYALGPNVSNGYKPTYILSFL